MLINFKQMVKVNTLFQLISKIISVKRTIEIQKPQLLVQLRDLELLLVQIHQDQVITMYQERWIKNMENN